MGGRPAFRALARRTFPGAESESVGEAAPHSRRRKTLRFALAQTPNRRGHLRRADSKHVRGELSPRRSRWTANTFNRGLSPAASTTRNVVKALAAASGCDRPE